MPQQWTIRRVGNGTFVFVPPDGASVPRIRLHVPRNQVSANNYRIAANTVVNGSIEQTMLSVVNQLWRDESGTFASLLNSMTSRNKTVPTFVNGLGLSTTVPLEIDIYASTSTNLHPNDVRRFLPTVDDEGVGAIGDADFRGVSNFVQGQPRSRVQNFLGIDGKIRLNLTKLSSRVEEYRAAFQAIGAPRNNDELVKLAASITILHEFVHLEFGGHRSGYVPYLTQPEQVQWMLSYDPAYAKPIDVAYNSGVPIRDPLTGAWITKDNSTISQYRFAQMSDVVSGLNLPSAPGAVVVGRRRGGRKRAHDADFRANENWTRLPAYSTSSQALVATSA